MIWVNFITTEPWSPEAWNQGFKGKSSPFMAELFRFVKYYNLPIYIYICAHVCIYIYMAYNPTEIAGTV